MPDTPTIAARIKLPALEVSNTRTLAPASLLQVKQAVVPVVQQLVQAAGIKLNSAQQAELSSAFVTRGIINIPATADAGMSVNVEATSLTYNERQLAIGEAETVGE